MYKTERILIKPDNGHHKKVHRLCMRSAKVYDQALYYFRQAFFNHETFSWFEADKLLKLKHADLYNQLPNAISQQVIKKLGSDFKSFWQAHKAYKKQPDKFKARPKIPCYRGKKGAKTAIQPAQGLSVIDGQLVFPKKMQLQPLSIHCCKAQALLAKKDTTIIKEIRYVPHGSCYWIEIIYNEAKTLDENQLNKRKIKLNPNNVFSLDLGINNLVTLISNKADFQPLLFSGKPIKSLNQRFNKQKAVLQNKGHKRLMAHQSVKRFCHINDYFHKVSRKIVELCLENDIGKLVIGKNKHWKQDINIGKTNNQKFVSIPYQSLIEKITYKAQAYGIEVIEQEEAYTSKADSLACDPIPRYKKDRKLVFSGKRKKRGLYQSSVGKLLNADVNGAINILRKVIGDDFVKNLADKGAVFAPMRWKPAH
jgi:putative transposase